MMIIKLLQIELIKTKKSLALLMMFLSPLMVLLVNLLLFINRKGVMVESKGWGMFWLTNYGMWGYFMMPLYIALITTLLNGIEHQSNGWRFMMSLPIKQKDVFIAKFLLAWVYLIGASLVLFLSILITILVLTLLGYTGDNILSLQIVKNLAYANISCLGILSIQHIVSWRWKNVVVPLGLGVLATMSIMQFSNSEYWSFNPWTYTLMATNASNGDMQTQALLYSVLFALILSLIGMRWLGNREVTC
jgi:hypothetical protein